jgi:uncharacterized membrane protein YgcG
VNVLVDAPMTQTGNAEVQQAYDPSNGYLYETWICCYVSGIGFARSTDGGVSFENASELPGSSGYSWDPSITVGPNGTVLVGYMTQVNGHDTPRVDWSFDHGASFAGNSTVFPGSSTTDFSDRDYVGISSNGTWYVSWDYSPYSSYDYLACPAGGSCYFTAGDYNVVVARSWDEGAHWSTPVAVDPEYPWGGAIAGPFVLTPNGTLEVVYEDYATSGANHTLGTGYNYYASSSDGGASFSAPVAVSSLPLPNAAWWIDGSVSRASDGTLYAGFDSLNTTDLTDVGYVVASTDGGSHWGNPLAVTHDNGTAAHIMVTVAAGENGTAFVAWITNNSSGANWTTYESIAFDFGSQVTPPALISAIPGVGAAWPGDTIGLSLLDPSRAAVSWTEQNSSVGYDQIYEAVVSMPVPATPLPPSITPGVAQARVSWAPVASTPVLGYQVLSGVSSGPSNVTVVNATTLSATFTNLSRNVPYTFQVIAFNAAGASAPSLPRNVTLTAWGRIVGTVQPANSTVTVDGMAIPVTAGAFDYNTTPGRHSLAASFPNYRGVALNLTVGWNSTVRKVLQLTSLLGEIDITVVPALHATASVGGVAVALNASGRAAVAEPAGTYWVSAGAPGYLPFGENVTVGFGQRTPVFAVLSLNQTAASGGNGSGGNGSGGGGGGSNGTGGNQTNRTPVQPRPLPESSPFPLELVLLIIVVAVTAALGGVVLRLDRKRAGRPPRPGASTAATGRGVGTDEPGARKGS